MRFVHTDQITTFRARPSLLLSGDKFADTDLTDHLKVLDHAHAVFCSIALVKSFESCARKRGTDKTKLLLAVSQRLAMRDLTGGAVVGLIGVLAMAARARFLGSNVAATKAAVHSARRNKVKHSLI